MRIAFLLLLGAAVFPACARAEPAPRRPNVVLILLDTLRADRLSCYGGPRPTSPHLDALAAEGILFEQARAPSPYTATSHSTLFASLDPEVHGVWNVTTENGAIRRGDALSPRATTLAEAMRDAGYQTAAITDGGNLSVETGLDQGFELFEAEWSGAVNRVDRALSWLDDERKDGQPFFLFLHTYETHLPYMPDRDVMERFAPDYRGPLWEAYLKAMEEVESTGKSRKRQQVQRKFFLPVLQNPQLSTADKEFFMAMYDAEIALADREVGRFLAGLAAAGLQENTIVLVTSDHGESFWEQGAHGHFDVFEPLLHVPLIVRGPGAPAGIRRPDAVGLLDLMPSLLAAVGLPAPPEALGVDIGLLSATPSAERTYFAAANLPYEELAARRGDWKWFRHSFGARPAEVVFDLHTDPRETADCSRQAAGAQFLSEMRVLVAERAARLLAFREQHRLGAVPPVATDVGRTGELAELGYTED